MQMVIITTTFSCSNLNALHLNWPLPSLTNYDSRNQSSSKGWGWYRLWTDSVFTCVYFWHPLHHFLFIAFFLSPATPHLGLILGKVQIVLCSEDCLFVCFLFVFTESHVPFGFLSTASHLKKSISTLIYKWFIITLELGCGQPRQKKLLFVCAHLSCQSLGPLKGTH